MILTCNSNKIQLIFIDNKRLSDRAHFSLLPLHPFFSYLSFNDEMIWGWSFCRSWHMQNSYSLIYDITLVLCQNSLQVS